jgi:hypothetical protein
MQLLVSACRLLATPVALFFLILATGTPGCNAQTQQPFLFAGQAANGQISGFAVFVRNDQTGDLTEVAGSPFTTLHSTTCVMTVVDPKGRFTYGPCGLGASMYSLNATTGALAEVAGSPFGASTDTTPGDVVAESTGQYVYVLKFSLEVTYPAISSVTLDMFSVDSTNEQLVAQSSEPFELFGTLVAVAASPHGFYLLMNVDDNSNPYPTAELYGMLFDPTSGQTTGPQLLEETGNDARAMMIDSAGKNLVISAGDQSGSLWFFQLSPADGTVVGYNTVSLAFEEFATPIAFDPTSTYFYLEFDGMGATESGIRIFNVATQSETASSPVPASLESELGGQPDPQGAFWYFSGAAPSEGISVFGVDLTTGYPITPTAFSNPLFPGRNLGPGPATIDVNTQPVQAPAMSLSATMLSFGSVDVGESSNTQTVTLTSTGSLALTLSSIQVTGANAGDFIEADTCMSSPQLQPNKTCVINVTFRPSVNGAESATILVTDNASGSPQQIALSGTGANAGPPPARAPAVVLNPSPFTFPNAVTEGTTGASQNLVISNTGTATLQVQSIALDGPNSGDFAISANNCVGAVPASSNCLLSLTFSPLGPGVRSAVLTITDNASNSPQTLNISGTSAAAAEISGTGSMSASVSAGQSAQFSLQATAGSGFSGTLMFACTGAPAGASCSAPSNVAVGAGTPTTFTVTVSTSGSSAMLPGSPLGLGDWIGAMRMVSFFGALLALILLRRFEQWRLRSWAFGAAAGLLLCAAISLGGCGSGGGGGSATSQTSAAVTPSGTYTISLTPTATASGASTQFQLTAITLTLTVN